MDDTQKPFACKANGCGMRFTTEDSLMGHKQKHAMSLPVVGADNKAASFGVDQTPTPTSFIRTCDEYGLFDMLTCNPFEDSFRRTNEAKSIAGTPNDVAPDGVGSDEYKLTILRSENGADQAKGQHSTAEDTLNTPHVLPYYNVTVADCQFIDVPSAGKRSCVSETSSPEKVRKVTHSVDHNEKCCAASESPATPMKMPKLLRLSPPVHVNGVEKRTSPVIMHTQFLTAVPKLVQLNSKPKAIIASSNQHDSNPLIIDVDKCSDALEVTLSSQNTREKLKRQIIQKTHSEVQQSAKLFDFVDRAAVSELSMQSTLTDKIVSSISTATSPMCTEPALGQRFERNRAAAQRYRSKMKQWKAEMLTDNTRLEEENRTLRAEIEKLNIILLAHQKCSVTKAMAQGNCIPVGLPKVIIKSAHKQPSDKRPLRPNKQSISNNLTPAALLTVNNGDITTNPIYFLVNQKPSNSTS